MKLADFRFLLGTVNWLGLVLGVLMLILPFLGFWWIVKAGNGAFELSTSPFDINVALAGQAFRTTLVELFLLFARISFLLAGAFMIIGSVRPRAWFSKRLVRFGVMKPFWSVVMLVIMVVAGTFLINNVVPGLLSSAASQQAGGAVQTQVNIPYFTGVTQATIVAGPATISAPITLELTGAFWLAVFMAGLGIATRIILRKFHYLDDGSNNSAEKKLIKVRPT